MDVLFVEDHADTRDAVEYLLRNRGATVRAATSVDEALSLYRERPPAILVTDLGLGQQSGVDLIRRIRAIEDPLGVHTPAIAVSGFVGVEDMGRAAGFDAQLPKPLEFPVLVERMLALLGRVPTER